MAKQAPKLTQKQGKSRSGTHQVRIIGGDWKRTPILVTDAEGLRPTPDRVRETVFNWLGHLMDNRWEQLRCLDAFAGTGVLGFEAASRGAAHVTMIENHTPAIKQLGLIKDKLRAEQVQIVRGDALTNMQALQGKGAQFDLIFIDPPYHLNWLERVLPLCRTLLSAGGLLYVESEFSLEAEPAPAWLENWEVVRADKAGMVFYHVLQAEKIGQLQA